MTQITTLEFPAEFSTHAVKHYHTCNKRRNKKKRGTKKVKELERRYRSGGNKGAERTT